MKSSLLILLCLKVETHPMALNTVLFSFTNTTAKVQVPQSQFFPPMEIFHTGESSLHEGNLTSMTFSAATSSKQGYTHPISFIQHFTSLSSLPTHPISRDLERQRASHSPGTFCGNFSVNSIAFKAWYLALDIRIDGRVCRISENQFPLAGCIFAVYYSQSRCPR